MVKNMGVLALIIILCQCPNVAQTPHADTITRTRVVNNLKSCLIPASMITYGIASFRIPEIRQLDFLVRDLQPGHQVTMVDDYLIYVPLASDILMNLSGIVSQHKPKDKVLIYLLSSGLNAALVYPVKRWTSRPRPDQSDLHSFPSGHASNAFVGAEYFWQEYKKKSMLLASAGYIVASSTAFLRIRNNKHWLSDVVTGAGIGILSTKLIYHLYPYLSNKLFKNPESIVFLPYSFFDGVGISIVMTM